MAGMDELLFCMCCTNEYDPEVTDMWVCRECGNMICERNHPMKSAYDVAVDTADDLINWEKAGNHERAPGVIKFLSSPEFRAVIRTIIEQARIEGAKIGMKAIGDLTYDLPHHISCCLDQADTCDCGKGDFIRRGRELYVRLSGPDGVSVLEDMSKKR